MVMSPHDEISTCSKCKGRYMARPAGAVYGDRKRCRKCCGEQPHGDPRKQQPAPAVAPEPNVVQMRRKGRR